MITLLVQLQLFIEHVHVPRCLSASTTLYKHYPRVGLFAVLYGRCNFFATGDCGVVLRPVASVCTCVSVRALTFENLNLEISFLVSRKQNNYYRHRPTEFHPNRAIRTTLYRHVDFSRWRPRHRKSTSGFEIGDVNVEFYLRSKCRRDIPIHSSHITIPLSENKQPLYIGILIR